MTAFPAQPPPQLNDAKIIQNHDWQAYRELDQMENHWNRPGWTDGRRSYHWMLTFSEAENVCQLAKHCQVQLEHPGLDVVPLDTLHVTIGRLGFTDELLRREADAIADVAKPLCERVAPISLTIGPLAGSKGAIRFSLSPWSELTQLHRQLAAATRTIRGAACPMKTSDFRPHLSIAYANRTIPLASLLPRMEALRSLPTETATISAVQLVELQRVGRAYRYDILHQLCSGQVP